MTDQERDLLAAGSELLGQIEDLLQAISEGRVRLVDTSGVDIGASWAGQLEPRARTVRSQLQLLAGRSARDLGDFIIDDIMRQAAAIRRADDEPVLIHISGVDWGRVQRSPNALHIVKLGPPPRISDIEVSLDFGWSEPVLVVGRAGKRPRPRPDPI